MTRYAQKMAERVMLARTPPRRACRFFNGNLGRQFLFGGHDPVLGQVQVGFLDFIRQTAQAAA